MPIEYTESSTGAGFFHLELYGILFQIYVLYINDYADEELDLDNHTYWSSGGSRVIPQGKLSGQALWIVSWVILGLLLAQALYWWGSLTAWNAALNDWRGGDRVGL